jgi:radical SAM superfamily enzyme YgiQ (UPF0313 family)
VPLEVVAAPDIGEMRDVCAQSAINRNTEELTEAELDWADLVMTGGMLAQQFDTLRVIEIAPAASKPVAVGGPDPTSSPQIYAAADFQVLGEAESIIDEFIAAWRRGDRSDDSLGMRQAFLASGPARPGLAEDFKEGPPVSGIGGLMPSRVGKPKYKAGVRHENSFFRHM